MIQRSEIVKQARTTPIELYKFKTISEFEYTLDLYCQHLAKGLSRYCFVECDYRTIEKYLFNEEFFRQTLQANDVDLSEYQKKYYQALKQNRKVWEAMGIQGTFGIVTKEQTVNDEGKLITKTITPKKFNALSYIFNMKNRFPNEWNRDRTKLDISSEVRTLNIDIQLSEKMKDDPNIRKLVRDLQFQIGDYLQSSSSGEVSDDGRVEDTTTFTTD